MCLCIAVFDDNHNNNNNSCVIIVVVNVCAFSNNSVCLDD